MDQLNHTTKRGKDKHLNYKKRLKIEALSKAGLKSEKIGRIIGCTGRAVRNELAKGNHSCVCRVYYKRRCCKKTV